jgi:hypothetical protein
LLKLFTKQGLQAPTNGFSRCFWLAAPLSRCKQSPNPHVTCFPYRSMALVSRLFTSPSYSRQVILLVRTRCSSLANRSSLLSPPRSGKSNGVNCSWRFFNSTTALLRNAGLKATEKVIPKKKIKSEEIRRLFGLAKPEKYRLLGIFLVFHYFLLLRLRP